MLENKIRISYPGITVHIMDHAVENNLLFKDVSDYKKYMDVLVVHIKQENVILHSYCLMPNHIHLLATFPDENMSRFMQSLKTKYSKYYNNKYQIRGHLFMGRFKSIVVTTNKYLIIASKYIHLNPVAKGIAKLPSNYLWSSYNDIINKKSDIVYLKTIEEVSGGIKPYRSFVEEGLNSDINALISIQKDRGALFYGRMNEIKRIWQIYDRRLNNKEKQTLQKRNADIISKKYRYDKVIKAFEKISGVSVEEIKTSGKHEDVKLKAQVIYILRNLTLLTEKEIALMMGYKNKTTITKAIERVDKKALSSMLNKILSILIEDKNFEGNL